MEIKTQDVWVIALLLLFFGCTETPKEQSPVITNGSFTYPDSLIDVINSDTSLLLPIKPLNQIKIQPYDRN